MFDYETALETKDDPDESPFYLENHGEFNLQVQGSTTSWGIPDNFDFGWENVGSGAEASISTLSFGHVDIDIKVPSFSGQTQYSYTIQQGLCYEFHYYYVGYADGSTSNVYRLDEFYCDTGDKVQTMSENRRRLHDRDLDELHESNHHDNSNNDKTQLIALEEEKRTRQFEHDYSKAGDKISMLRGGADSGEEN